MKGIKGEMRLISLLILKLSNFNTMKKYAFLFLLAITAGMFQSCKKDEIIEQPQNLVAPELPAQKMMIMPFDAFADTDTSEFHNGGDLDAKTNNTYFNWFHAGINLVFWNSVVAVQMAIPVGAFLESFNHPAVYIGDNTFQWSYNAEVLGSIYLVRLTGKYLITDEVEWILYAEQLNGFDEIVFFAGTVALDGSNAEFIINHKPNSPEPFLLVQYNEDLSSGDGSIRYTNVEPTSNDNGNYIEYRVDSAAEYNRAYDVYGGNPIDFLQIEWNEPLFDGRVKHPRRFNDTDFHCWDTNQMDIDC